MRGANDNRPSFVDRPASHGDKRPYYGAKQYRDRVVARSIRSCDNHEIEQSEKRDEYIHRLQPRFPSAIQPVRLSRGEVARIPELMRILDRRTAKK